MGDLATDQIDFTMFVLYKIAKRWDCSVPEAYDLLQRADIVNGYIIPCYDVLHTLGSQYITDDIDELAAERGVRP